MSTVTNMVSPDIANLCSALTLAILVLCLLGILKLSCRMDGRQGMENNPLGYLGKGWNNAYDAMRSDAAGSDSGGNYGGRGRLNLMENQMDGGNSQGFLVRGFTNNGANQPPVFWNPGDVADINAVQQAAAAEMGVDVRNGKGEGMRLSPY